MEEASWILYRRSPCYAWITFRFSNISQRKEPPTVTIHCIIHCQALASKTLPEDLSNTMESARKMMNTVKRSVLNTRIFKKLWAALDSVHLLKQLSEPTFVMQLAYLVDIFGHFNQLNLQLQDSGNEFKGLKVLAIYLYSKINSMCFCVTNSCSHLTLTILENSKIRYFSLIFCFCLDDDSNHCSTLKDTHTNNTRSFVLLPLHLQLV